MLLQYIFLKLLISNPLHYNWLPWCPHFKKIHKMTKNAFWLLTRRCKKKLKGMSTTKPDMSAVSILWTVNKKKIKRSTFKQALYSSHLFNHRGEFCVLRQKFLHLTHWHTTPTCNTRASSWLAWKQFGTIWTVELCKEYPNFKNSVCKHGG